MNVERFDHSKHSRIIGEWLIEHGMNADLSDHLPSIGFISMEEKEPVAAGFLRRIESCHEVLLDGIISNPKSRSQTRDRALDMLFKKIIETSKGMGIHTLIGNTIDEHTGIRALKHGFQTLPYTLYAIDLRGQK